VFPVSSDRVLFFRIVENAIPFLEVIGGCLAGMRTISESIVSRLACSCHAKVGALDLDNESIVLKLVNPFADRIPVDVQIPGAISSGKKHRVLGLGVAVFPAFKVGGPRAH
jgi:hypothetical protein